MPKEASCLTQAWEKHGPLASRHQRSVQPLEKAELRWPRAPSFPCGLDGGVTWLPDSPQGHQRPQPNPSSFQSSDTWRPRTSSPPACDGRRPPAPRPGFSPASGTGSRLPGAEARRGHRRGARPAARLPAGAAPQARGPGTPAPRPTPPAPPEVAEIPGTFFFFFGTAGLQQLILSL